MNLELIRNLVQLRYKLLWAKTRSRNGRIALFMAGYLLLLCLLALLLAGGFQAGFVAVKSGKARLVAQVVLSAIYVQALLATSILGFGVNAAFSDAELRRYPLKAVERRVARHLIGIADPFWSLFLFLEIGLLLGLYGFGAASLAWGSIAVLLLFVSNYLLARVLALVIERLMKRKGGPAILMLFIMCFAFLPSLLAQRLSHAKGALAWIPQALRYTPAFGAASAMTGSGIEAMGGLTLLAAWVAAAIIALVALERRPTVTRVAQTTKISWDSGYDRWARIFGERDAPYIAHWLRFYVRNGRFRTLYAMSILIGVFLTASGGASRVLGNYFASALGALPVMTFIGNSRMAVNQFGYTGGGFRRFFLLPTDSAATLRTGSYASMLLGFLMIPVGLLAWMIFAPVPVDARGLLMLAGSGITGVFVFHALGLWSTMLSPRKGDYSSNFGNDLSLGGNIVLIGGVMVFVFAPRALARLAPAFVSPAKWWEVIPAMAAGTGFYYASLRAAAALLRARRERLLAVVEGRDV